MGIRSGAFAESDPSAHDAGLPKWTIGKQMYSLRQVLPANPTEQQRITWLDEYCLQNYKFVVIETHGNMYAGLGAAGYSARIRSLGGYSWGDHNGGRLSAGGNTSIETDDTPNPTAINTALQRMHDLQSPTVGSADQNVGGWNSQYNVARAHRAANLYNNWGNWLQMGDAIEGVTVPGIPGATYYFHPHQGEWSLVTDANNSGEPQHNGRRVMEVVYDDLDTDYGMIEIDLAWARHGQAMGPATDYEGGFLFIDVVTAHEEKTYAYHVKGSTGGTGFGVEVDCNLPPFQPGEAGSAIDPYSGQPVAGNPSDTLPWQHFFDTMKWPEKKKFLWERDSTAGSYETKGQRFAALLHGAQLDRSIIGAPANVTPPSIWGISKVGKKLTVQHEDRGEWVRHPKARYEFQWLRNGTQPIEGATRNRYIVQPQDAGWDIVVGVTAINNSGNTSEASAPVSIVGAGPENVAPPSLSGSGKVGTMITVDQGEWNGSGPYTFQWKLDGVPVPTGTGPGQTGSTNPKRYRCKAGEVGQEVTCDVTRTNPSGSTTVSSSNSVVVNTGVEAE